MRLRSYLRGLGIGMVVTSLVMGYASSGKDLTDAQIRQRAKQLGMVEGKDTVLADVRGISRNEAVRLLIDDTKDKTVKTSSQKVTEIFFDDPAMDVAENTSEMPEESDSGKVEEKAAQKTEESVSGKVEERAAQKTDESTAGKKKEGSTEKSKSSTAGKVKEDSTEKSKSSTAGKVKEDSAEKSKSSTAGKVKEDSTEKSKSSTAGKVKEDSAEKSKSSTSVKVKEDSTEKSKESTSEKVKESASEKKKDGTSEKKQEMATEGSGVSIVINSGESSTSVAEKLKAAGVIDDAAAFDRFLCENGYDRKINTGHKLIPAGASKVEIAGIITVR